MPARALDAVDGLAREVFDCMCVYVRDEAIVFPSMKTLARDVTAARRREARIFGRARPDAVSRKAICRAIHRLAADYGWIRFMPRRRYLDHRWEHNVYELLEAPTRPILEADVRRIVRRAHRHRPPTSSVSGHGRCRCWFCRPPEPRKTSPPPPIPALADPPMRVRVMREVRELVERLEGRRSGWGLR